MTHVDGSTRFRLARGMKLGRDPQGEAILLVPEGIVSLNETAAATLEVLDGRQSLDDVVRILGERFDAAESEVRADVESLLAELAERGFVVR